MDITKLGEARAERDAKEKEMLEAIQIYRETILNETSTRDEIKEACNNALRKAGELINLQAECINALVTAGQILGDYATGKKRGPTS